MKRKPGAGDDGSLIPAGMKGRSWIPALCAALVIVWATVAGMVGIPGALAIPSPPEVVLPLESASPSSTPSPAVTPTAEEEDIPTEPPRPTKTNRTHAPTPTANPRLRPHPAATLKSPRKMPSPLFPMTSAPAVPPAFSESTAPLFPETMASPPPTSQSPSPPGTPLPPGTLDLSKVVVRVARYTHPGEASYVQIQVKAPPGAPAITRLRVAGVKDDLYLVAPEAVTLAPGGAAMMFGRSKAATHTLSLTVSAVVGGATLSRSITLPTVSSASTGVETGWARARLAALWGWAARYGNEDLVRHEILRLSNRYKIPANPPAGWHSDPATLPWQGAPWLNAWAFPWLGSPSLPTALDGDRAAARIPAGGKRMLDPARLAGPALPSVPYGEMLKGRRPAVGPIEPLVPADALAVLCPSQDAAANLLDFAGYWGPDLLRLIDGGRDFAGLQARWERQLGLALRRDALPAGTLGACAVITGDADVLHNPSLALLAQVQDWGAWRKASAAWLAQAATAAGDCREGSESYRGVDIHWIVRADRAVASFRATLGSVAVVGNSRALVRRIIDASKWGAASMADQPDYLYVRSVLPAAGESALVYLSDRFIRTVIGPAYWITAARRDRCLGNIARLQDALLAYHVENHAPWSLEGLLRGQFLVPTPHCPDGGRYVAAVDGTVRCSVHGGIESPVPVVDLPRGLVSAGEAAAYRDFVVRYRVSRSPAWDPAVLQIRLNDVAALKTVLPLSQDAWYRALAAWIGGTPTASEALAAAPASAAATLGVTLAPFQGYRRDLSQISDRGVRDQIAQWREALIQSIGWTEPEDPLAWIGPDAALGLLDGPGTFKGARAFLVLAVTDEDLARKVLQRVQLRFGGVAATESYHDVILRSLRFSDAFWFGWTVYHGRVLAATDKDLLHGLVDASAGRSPSVRQFVDEELGDQASAECNAEMVIRGDAATQMRRAAATALGRFLAAECERRRRLLAGRWQALRDWPPLAGRSPADRLAWLVHWGPPVICPEGGAYEVDSAGGAPSALGCSVHGPMIPPGGSAPPPSSRAAAALSDVRDAAFSLQVIPEGLIAETAFTNPAWRGPRRSRGGVRDVVGDAVRWITSERWWFIGGFGGLVILWWLLRSRRSHWSERRRRGHSSTDKFSLRGRRHTKYKLPD